MCFFFLFRNSLDGKSLKQQELLYQQDFAIQQLERKVARASGERTNEEKKILNAKIEALQAVCCPNHYILFIHNRASSLSFHWCLFVIWLGLFDVILLLVHLLFKTLSLICVSVCLSV